MFAVLLVVALFGAEETHWAPSFRDSTLIFGRENLQRIWKWEIESGHYPSIAKSVSPPGAPLANSLTPLQSQNA